MHLIILYGPPGVGKLTVAKELAEQTSYKLFHNHITIDAVSSLFDTNYYRFWQLNRELRLLLLEEAARAHLPGIILTYCYDKPAGDSFIQPLLSLAETYSICLDFVYLHCSEEEQYKRVESPSRQGTTKLHTKEALQKALSTFNYAQILYVESLVIDNTALSPENVASMIIREFQTP